MTVEKHVQEIGMETNLRQFSKIIGKARQNGELQKDFASHRVMSMLCRLYDGDELKIYVPRKINTVEGLYSFTDTEIINGFKGYKKKTWLKLTEILKKYGLPSLELPQKYTID